MICDLWSVTGGRKPSPPKVALAPVLVRFLVNHNCPLP